MAHAETCPLCKGTGNKDGAKDNLGGTIEICRGCEGSGWVSVQDEVVSWPVMPQPYMWPPPSFTSDPYSNSQTAVQWPTN